ncbi:MAG: hypothetical protein AMXMBFR53_37090 [Gemmatimonadota bacterium]
METAAPTETRTLSREMSEFLVEFSIGVHRYVMYPSGHPSLAPVVESIVMRLAEILAERRTLSIGVAQRQLIIEGVATDQKHPVLSDLAQRLHDHQLGAVTVEIGVTATDIAALLAALARETERGGTPLGLLPPAEVPTWDFARLHPVGYDRLTLLGDGTVVHAGTGWADALWLGLAQATLGEGTGVPGDADGEAMAGRVRSQEGRAAYERVIAEYLRKIPRELRGREGGDSEKLRQKVADFLHRLDDGTLSRLVGYGDPGERRQFLLDANQGLAVDSVMKILRASAEAEGQSISHSMTRMLSKLAFHAEQASGSQSLQADTALRENVESLIRGWSLESPNPDAYTNVLDSMSRASPLFHPPAVDESRITGAERLVDMALEVDAYGPIVAKAVTDFMEEGGAGRMLVKARQAPAESAAARSIRAAVLTPKQFRHLLAEGKVDDEGLKRLLEEMGDAAVDPLLDVLSESQDRSVRRRVFDALLSLGGTVGDHAVARLPGSPWFVQRNMLALLHRLAEVPAGFDPLPYLRHGDARVRREALPLALRLGSRERVLVVALADDDERVLRMALGELQEGVSDAVLPTLVNRVVRAADRPSEVRTAAVRLLGAARAPLALTTLVDMVTAGKTLLGRRRLAPSTPEVLVALRTLALSWAERDEVREILDQAAKARDPDIRGAVHVTRSSRTGGAP